MRVRLEMVFPVGDGGRGKNLLLGGEQQQLETVANYIGPTCFYF
jgi:hypothetical protein